MIPSRTTFHKAVGEATHVMQRRMVAVLAALSSSSRSSRITACSSDSFGCRPDEVVVKTTQGRDRPSTDGQGAAIHHPVMRFAHPLPGCR